jgi:hypothetical protein
LLDLIETKMLIIRPKNRAKIDRICTDLSNIVNRLPKAEAESSSSAQQEDHKDEVVSAGQDCIQVEAKTPIPTVRALVQHAEGNSGSNAHQIPDEESFSSHATLGELEDSQPMTLSSIATTATLTRPVSRESLRFTYNSVGTAVHLEKESSKSSQAQDRRHPLQTENNADPALDLEASDPFHKLPISEECQETDDRQVQPVTKKVRNSIELAQPKLENEALNLGLPERRSQERRAAATWPTPDPAPPGPVVDIGDDKNVAASSLSVSSQQIIRSAPELRKSWRHNLRSKWTGVKGFSRRAAGLIVHQTSRWRVNREKKE